MLSKRSLAGASIYFIAAIGAVYQIARLGHTYGYGAPLIGSVAVGVAAAPLLLFAVRQIWRMPRAAAVLWGIGTAVVFFVALPQILLNRWAHSGRGYALGLFTLVFLELCFREVVPPKAFAPPRGLTNVAADERACY